MRMKALSSSASAFCCRLASVCLRYGVAKHSVWPCRRVCKCPHFNDFRFDSPLNFTLWWFQFRIVGAALRVWRSLVVHSNVCRSLRTYVPVLDDCWLLSRVFLLALRAVWSCVGGLESFSSPSRDGLTPELVH